MITTGEIFGLLVYCIGSHIAFQEIALGIIALTLLLDGLPSTVAQVGYTNGPASNIVKTGDMQSLWLKIISNLLVQNPVFLDQAIATVAVYGNQPNASCSFNNSAWCPRLRIFGVLLIFVSIAAFCGVINFKSPLLIYPIFVLGTHFWFRETFVAMRNLIINLQASVVSPKASNDICAGGITNVIFILPLLQYILVGKFAQILTLDIFQTETFSSDMLNVANGNISNSFLDPFIRIFVGGTILMIGLYFMNVFTQVAGLFA